MARPRLSARVARIVSDQELIINAGTREGIKVGMMFFVPDERTQNIVDPVTKEPLGSLDRPRARMKVVEVTEKIALMRRVDLSGSILSKSLYEMVSGASLASSVRPAAWSEGVTVGTTVIAEA